MTKNLPGDITPTMSVIVNGDDEDGALNLDWKPEPVSDTTEIWRYRNLKRYISILDGEHLWFSRLDKFEDPFEGSIPRKNKEYRTESYRQEIDRGRSTAREAYAYMSYVNCWYNEEHESDAMWQLCSNNGDGIAIKSTHGKLKQALRPTPSTHNPKKDTVEKAVFGNVNYIDYNEEQTPTNSILAPIFHKRNAFEFEKEYRATVQFQPDELIYGSDKSKEGWFDFSELNPAGIPVPVDASKLIQEAVVSPTASDNFVETVKSVTKKYGYDFDVVQSDLHEDPFF